MSSNEAFRLDKIERHFSQCLAAENTILLEPYLDGFNELTKFFVLLGRAFGWIAEDLQSKVAALNGHRQKDFLSSHSYKDFRSMVKHESGPLDLIKKRRSTDSSGTRSFLRLHRVLKFVLLFLSEAQEAKDDDRLCPLSRKAYDQSLGKHHSYLVQKVSKLAMEALPSKSGLVESIYPNDEKGSHKCAEAVPKVVSTLKTVFKTSAKIFEEFGLRDLR